MCADATQKTINVAPINLGPHEEGLVRKALDTANAQGNSAPYVFLSRAEAREAEILIAHLESSDLNRTSQVLKKVYGAKSTIFIVQDEKTVSEHEYKYVIRRKDLDQSFTRLLDTVSRDELGTLFSSAERSSEGQNPSRVQAVSYQAPLQSAPRLGRVLVVDDSASVRTQMNLYLNRRNFECVLVDSAEEALRAVKQDKFDLIFLDIIMPGADGYQACKAIKSFEGSKQVPVIMLTSKNSPIDRIHGIMSGCEKYLTKPVRASELDSLLGTYFPSFKPAPAVKNQS